MFNPFKRQNRYVKFLEKEVFNREVYSLLDESFRLVQTLLADAIKKAHGKSARAKKRLEDMLAEPPTAHVERFKNLYYLMFFHEIAQTVGPVKNYKVTLNDRHLKYAAHFVEQKPRMLKKFQADLQSFLFLYKKTQLAALEEQERDARAVRLKQLAQAVRPLGFRAVPDQEGYYTVEPDEIRRKELYDLWYGNAKTGTLSKFLNRFKGPQTSYSGYLKKLRRQRSVRQLAELVLNRYPFGNPTKIKTLIVFSVIIKEEVTTNIQRVIDEENKKRVRPQKFFNADLKKLSAQVQKRSGEYYSQLGRDLNSFVSAVRRTEETGNRLEEEEVKEQREHWQQIKKALDALGFDYTEMPNGKVMKLTGPA